MSLSLSNGKKLFHQIDENGKRIQTIYYNPVHKKHADVEVENFLDVLTDHDFKSIKRKMKLSEYDIQQLKRFLKAKDCEKITNGVIMNAYSAMVEIVNEKLKNMLLFDDTSEKKYELIPAVDKDGYMVCSIIGASGSGKSTLAKKIIKANRRGAEQKVYLLTRTLKDPDPAFDEIQDMIEVIAVDKGASEYPALEDLENNWLLIDDLEGLPKNLREEAIDFVSSIITTGRKMHVKTIFSAHLSNGFQHRHLENESQWKIVFPSSSKWRVRTDLRLRYYLPTCEINTIFNAVKKDTSRYLILHLHSPQLYATRARIVLM